MMTYPILIPPLGPYSDFHTVVFYTDSPFIGQVATAFLPDHIAWSLATFYKMVKIKTSC